MSNYPSIGDEVLVTIEGQQRECVIQDVYEDGRFVLFTVLDSEGVQHSDLLPFAIKEKAVCQVA